jgi:DNA mismatch endonuclease, patch repair protein
MPRANGVWWREKLEKNVQRDIKTTEQLKALGWSVIRIWEHEDPEIAANRIETELRGGIVGRPQEPAALGPE